jgi:hypothetical protein
MYAMATNASRMPNSAKKVASFFTVPGGNILKTVTSVNKHDDTSPVK